MLTITHTHEAGTLLEGTTRGDGTAEIAKAQRMRWGRTITAWYLPRSRDQFARVRSIDALAAALRTAGHDVEVRIEDTPRDIATIEADTAHRAGARAAGLAAKAERKEAVADAAWQRHETAVERLPAFGEPVKIGHHSEGRHRRALTRAWDTMGKSVEAQEAATEAAAAAATAAHTTGSRYNPVTVANRIRTLAAETRKIERQIARDVYDPERGYRPATDQEKERRAAHMAPALDRKRDQVAYWTAIRDEQISEGKATNYGPGTVRKGDAVKIRGAWHRVVRANQKTVSVETGYTWTDRVPWHEVQDHRPATPDQQQATD